MTVLYTELGRDAKPARLSCHKSMLSYCKYLEMDTLLHDLWHSLFACYAEIRFKIKKQVEFDGPIYSQEFLWKSKITEVISIAINNGGVFCLFVCCCRFVLELSHSVMSDSEILWTVAHKDPLFMELIQARILDCFAISFSKWFSWLKDQTHLLCFLYCRWIFYPLSHEAE